MLAEHFNDPPAFVRSLHHLLDYYAERTSHSGQSGTPAPLLTAYKVRPPVLRMLLRELIPKVEDNPEEGLVMCDALWQEPVLEFRSLATMLLGQIPPACHNQIINRVKGWIKPELENFLIDELLTNGLMRIRKGEPQSIFYLIENWLGSENVFEKQLGLRALLPVIYDPDYENLPAYYRLINPLTRKIHPALRNDMVDVLIALAKRSPKETAYFLRQSLEISSGRDTSLLVRQTLPAFPTETQESLRSALRETGDKPNELN